MTAVDRMLTNPSKSDFWGTCLAKIEDEVTSQQYHTWFDSIQYSKIDNNTLYLTVANSFNADWVKKHYHQPPPPPCRYNATYI